MNSIIAAIFVVVLSIGCQNAEPQKQDFATASIEVKTVKCDLCSETITKALEHLDGVKKVSVDLKKKVATVEYVTSEQDVASLESSIAMAGYDANRTKRNEESYKALHPCCQ